MKYAFLLFAMLVVTLMATAQLKTKPDCGVITVDVYKGWINEAKPNADPEQIKAKLPCFTSADKEGNESGCGGGVYYDDKGICFYVQRDYIVITDAFKGKFTVPVLGAKSDDLFARFGNPKVKDANSANQALLSNNSMIKRPLIESPQGILLGFDEEEYKAKL